MKPLLISTYDTYGGAARAAHRLHDGLRRTGICSQMLVQKKLSADPSVLTSTPECISTAYHIARRVIDFVPLLPYRSVIRGIWSTGWFPGVTVSRINALNPDVVNLHWVGFGFMPLASIRNIRSPIVWTLHDMWPFTGGCHYPDLSCSHYEQSCGACPLLSSSDEHDVSSRLWQQRWKTLQGINLTIVSPSRWLAGCAGQSSLLGGKRVEVIPNGIDTDLFRPIEKGAARRFFGLPQDKKVILFGAVEAARDPRKGFPALVQALGTLQASFGAEEIVAVLFGSSHIPEGMGGHLPIRCFGIIGDDRQLSALYAAADLFIAPSVQDNLPNTILEAMACGTPCVAFSSGGIPDLVQHGRTGSLCPVDDPEAFAGEIARLLKAPELLAAMGAEARKRAVAEYSLDTVAQRYLDLYIDISATAKQT